MKFKKMTENKLNIPIQVRTLIMSMTSRQTVTWLSAGTRKLELRQIQSQ
jgi:hypothetical protein